MNSKTLNEMKEKIENNFKKGNYADLKDKIFEVFFDKIYK